RHGALETFRVGIQRPPQGLRWNQHLENCIWVIDLVNLEEILHQSHNPSGKADEAANSAE
ncbi:MAG: hypothetical protein RLZZ598_82, partial [Pseudomonadota bacterium]